MIVITATIKTFISILSFKNILATKGCMIGIVLIIATPLIGDVSSKPTWKAKVTRKGFNKPIKKGVRPIFFIDKSTLIIRAKINISKKAIANLTANRSTIWNSSKASFTNGGPEPNPITARNIAK